MTISSGTVDQAIANPAVPNPIGAMGNMVNLARGIQGYQAGAIELQAAQQANQERKNVINLVQSDPDFKPGPDGILDQSKIMPKLMQAAPQTYNQYAQNINQSNSGATTVNRQLLGLGQEKLNALSEVAGSLTAAGVKPTDIADQLTAYAEANPQAKGPVKMLLDQIKAANGDPQKIGMIMQQAATRTRSLADNFDTYQGALTAVGQGSQTALVVGQPKFTGQAPGTAVGQPIPMGVAPSYQLNQFGQPTLLPGAAPRLPNWTGEPPPSKGSQSSNLPPAPAFPSKFQAQNAADAQARWGAAQQRDVDPASGYNATSQTYKNLKDLLDKNPNLGPGSAGANQFIGKISTLTGHKIGDLNSAYQEAVGYLDRLSSQNSAATGAATNFAREQLASATGNPEVMGPTAIAEKLRFGSSVNEAAHAYTQASQQFVSKNGDRAYANPQAFEAAWSTNADPIAFRLMAAQKNGDTADFAATQARVKAMPVDQQAAIHQHYLALKNYLLKGQLPPNG